MAMIALLTELSALADQGIPSVFCRVVETRGSTPQKAGAAMLVLPDGRQHGTLGGGCVEAEVKRKALAALADSSGRPEVLSFCLDDNYGWDDGLICGGRMTMLLAPVLPGSPVQDYYRTYAQLIQQGQGCTEAVVFNESSELAIGSRFLFDAQGNMATQLADQPPSQTAQTALRFLQSRPGPYAQHGICYLPSLPKITLLIVGGGHVGQAVARTAAEVDFDIWVVDDREQYASPERFPDAQKRLVGEIGPTLRALHNVIHSGIYALVITRGHGHDEEALYYLATTEAGYVGMIGSKRKIRLIFEDLLAKGIPPAALERVHAPLGLDIGSQTVPEIAISIVAELIACRNLGTTRIPDRARISVGTQP